MNMTTLSYVCLLSVYLDTSWRFHTEAKRP